MKKTTVCTSILTEGRRRSERPGKPDGIIAIANAIPDMRAMTKFDITSNDLCTEGTELLAAALKGNQIMTELNISSNNMTYGRRTCGIGTWGDMSGVIALANVISDMRALTKIDLSRNNIPSDLEGGLQRICEAGGTELVI